VCAHLEVLLAMDEFARVEVGQDVGHFVGCAGGVVGRDDADGGEDVEVWAALEDQPEIGGVGAQAEIVQDGVFGGVRVRAWSGGFVEVL
jgi:hypothetical protein